MKTFWIIYGIFAVISIITLLIVSWKTLRKNWTEWYHPYMSMGISILGGILWPLFWLLAIVSVIWQKQVDKKYQEYVKRERVD